jgi:hypothetical protein
VRAIWSKSRVEKLRWKPALYKTARKASLIRITLTKLVPKKILRQKYCICLKCTNAEYARIHG